MVRLTKITTRRGDKGASDLADGSRLPKHALRFEAIGLVDGLNAQLGLICAHIGARPKQAAKDLRAELTRIQNDLFDAGADLAVPLRSAKTGKTAPKRQALRMVRAQVAGLERAIAAFNQDLPPLTSFVLPGGAPLAAELHVARAACRNAERAAWRLHHQRGNRLNPHLLQYLNRLSDFLFVAARVIQQESRHAPALWQPGRNQPS